MYVKKICKIRMNSKCHVTFSCFSLLPIGFEQEFILYQGEPFKLPGASPFFIPEMKKHQPISATVRIDKDIHKTGGLMPNPW